MRKRSRRPRKWKPTPPGRRVYVIVAGLHKRRDASMLPKLQISIKVSSLTTNGEIGYTFKDEHYDNIANYWKERLNNEPTFG